MTMSYECALQVKDYRLTIPREQLATVQQALEQAAQAGQSPHPFQPQSDLKSLVLIVWGLDLFTNRSDRALTELHVPEATSMQTFDTFLSLIAPFVAMNRPAYFDVLYQAEEGDREFFYHFEQGKVVKEERITTYIPAELEIRHPHPTEQQAQ
jgi:hypothetical protein